ncbi:MAG: hypothetical protein JJU29_06655 [Verrucomicrobia bacterium]|nr:hypothetical protein [Verrucomicrobiota bacterium]MCH8511554.1 hypothetical protein [Kiritimatiellia bacterium]
MNLFQVMIVASLVITVPVGLMVWLAQPRRRVNQAFLFLTCIIGLWQMALGFASIPVSIEHAMFWIRQSSAISALIPASMNLLRLTILYPGQGLLRSVRRGRHWFAGGLVALAICQTPWFLLSATLPGPDEVLAAPTYGPLFPYYAGYFLLALGVLVRKMTQDTRSASGIVRVEMEYMLMSCMVSLAVGIFFFLVPNLVGAVDLGAFLPLSVMVYSVIAAYGIATRGILDSPYVMRRILAYGLLLIYLVLLHGLTLSLATRLLEFLNHDPVPLNHFTATVVVVLSVVPAQGAMQRLANRLFIHGPLLDVGKTLGEAGRAMRAIATVEDLTRQFARILSEAVEATDIRVLVLRGGEGGGRFELIHPENAFVPPMTVRDPLPEYLLSQGGVVVQELMDRSREGVAQVEVRQQLRGLASAAIALTYQKKWVGLVLLGPRASGRIYGQLECETIRGLCDLFTVALENADLYTEVQNQRVYTDTLLEHLVSGVLAANLETGKITTCNREATRILEASYTGKPLTDLPEPIRDLLENPRLDQQVEFPDQGGVSRYLHVGSTQFQGHAEGEGETLLVMQDITHMKTMELHLRRSDRLASLGTLSAGMAHEIKNPMVTLKTFAQLLPERHDDPEFRDTFSKLALQEIHRIDRLVDQLLRLSRPSKSCLVPVEMHGMLEKSGQLLRQQAVQKQVKIALTLEAERDEVEGDPDHLHQAILNFLINGIESMPTGGQLTVHTENGNETLEIGIQDTGVGIERERLQHIFDPFYTTKDTGTGLGLSIAHQILHEHNGSVTVRSEPGQGCCFRIVLPLRMEKREE